MNINIWAQQQQLQQFTVTQKQYIGSGNVLARIKINKHNQQTLWVFGKDKKNTGATVVTTKCYTETIYKFWECISKNKNIGVPPQLL